MALTSFSVTAMGLLLSFFASYVGGAGAHFAAVTPGGAGSVPDGAGSAGREEGVHRHHHR